MDFQFILENMYDRGILSTRAFRILFTDTTIYFIHLGEDSTQTPIGAAAGGLAGAVAQSVADSHTGKKIAEKLTQLEASGPEAMLTTDKRSFKAGYSELEAFESASQKWNRWPQVVFRIKGKGKFKFTFDIRMENLEEERQAIVEFMRGKVPSLVKNED